MMAPEDILLEAMTAAIRYDNAPWLRRQMCAKLRESIRVESNYMAAPLSPPMVRDDR